MAIVLSTALATDNGGGDGGAVYFDLQVGNSPVTIISLDTTTSTVAAETSGFRIYTKLGTASGSETVSGDWSLGALGTIKPNGTSVPSPVTIDSPIVLNANTLYGFALIMPPSVDHRYNTGTCSIPYTVDGNCSFSDANLTLVGGAANAPPFSSTVFSPRIWSGFITYYLGTSLVLTADEKGQITFHLKQAGINFLPEMLTISYSLDELALIRAALTRVGQAYDQTLLNYEIKLGVDQNQTVQDLQTEVVRPDSTTTTTYGDRTITNYRYLSYSQRVSAYHREVEQLAIALGVI